MAALTAEKDIENSDGRTKRQPPFSRAPRAVPAAAAEVAAVATKEQHRDSLERAGGGLRLQKQEQQQLLQEHQYHQRSPGAPAPPAPNTATAAATAAAKPVAFVRGEERQSETQSTETDRILAEFEIAKEGRLAGVGAPLVPSFCPSEPFERYAAMHRDIMAGKLEPRWVGRKTGRGGGGTRLLLVLWRFGVSHTPNRTNMHRFVFRV